MSATGSDRKRPRLTVRVKLTALYGALFLAGGVVLLTVTYLLMRSRYPFLVKDASLHARQVGNPPQLELSLSELPPDDPSPAARTEKFATSLGTMTLDTLLLVSGLSLVAVTVIAVAAGWWMSGRVLRPLNTITATARRLSSSNLHERLAFDGPRDELTELAETFDGMLDRLESAFDSQRRFVANASHELRTPLAIQRAAVQIELARNPGPEKAAEVREQLLTANRQIERLIDGLLLLARSDRGLDKRHPVELHTVVGEAVSQYRPEAAQAPVVVETELAETTVLGDRALLTQLAGNLVANAVRHNTSGGTTWVRTDAPGTLTVANTGAMVTEDEIPRLLEPFHRGNGRSAAGSGSGLGLSIVDSIVRAHGGSLTVRPRPDGGMHVVVTIPVD
ncbi:ATP-binding protein [Amycolatopsis ultiminotia]|uniref:histidine kinase n=1 Tax=Amycolatopsis ultiminotia TaxID=543629 RepID=A0ABP6W4A1_9PSEU